MIYLKKAIYDDLVADVELVALIGHSVSTPKIFKGYPDSISVYPCVAFWEETTINYEYDNDEVQKTLMNVGIFVKSDDTGTYNSWTTKGILLCERVTQRVFDIFKVIASKDDYDLSNEQVKTLSVLFQNRLPIRFEDEADTYRCDLTYFINWYRK